MGEPSGPTSLAFVRSGVFSANLGGGESVLNGSGSDATPSEIDDNGPRLGLSLSWKLFKRPIRLSGDGSESITVLSDLGVDGNTSAEVIGDGGSNVWPLPSVKVLGTRSSR